MRRLRVTLLGAIAVMASGVLIAPAASADVTGVTVESTTRDSTGIAYVEVTATCTLEGDTVYLYSSVRQAVGRTQSVEGSGSTTTTCMNGEATGTVQVFPYEGKFAGGRAVIFVTACDSYTCSSTQEVRRLTPR
jgi:hypothetical protein